MNEIRIGYISSVSTETGAVRVTYEDRDCAVTAEIPIFNHSGEYFMPQVNDRVLVLHISNDSSMGVVLGTFWNQVDVPLITGSDVFFKPLSKDGACNFKQENGTVTLADHNGSFSVKEFMELKVRVAELERGES